MDTTTELEMNESAVKHEGKTLDHPATSETYGKGVYLWMKDTGIADLEGLHREQVLKWRTAILGRARQCGEWKLRPTWFWDIPVGALCQTGLRGIRERDKG